jgi:hypothetical protein
MSLPLNTTGTQYITNETGGGLVVLDSANADFRFQIDPSEELVAVHENSPQ